MQLWGKAGTVKIKIKTKTYTKIKDRGVHCMFAGYATNHSGDCFHMWDPTTGGIRRSCDIVWLHCMHYQKPSNAKELEVDNNAIVELKCSASNTVIKVGEGNNLYESDDEDDEESDKNQEKDMMPNDDQTPTKDKKDVLPVTITQSG